MYILVPSSWALIDGSEEAHQVHEDAEIRVELTNNLYGDTPFTLQTGECGKLVTTDRAVHVEEDEGCPTLTGNETMTTARL